MSDGGAESGRDYQHNTIKKNSGGTDDFAQSIAKIAVAQVCGSVGFQSFQHSALNTLADVAVRYISHLGKTAILYANLAGRNECNVFDIIQGLEDLGSQQGFLGASDINSCLAVSGIVQEIIRYVGEAEEIPFAHSIPRFPIVKDSKPMSSYMQIGETPPAEHVPAWLPAFPDRMTYVNSPLQHEREADTQSDKIAEAKEQKVERPLMNLQQELASNGSEVPTAVDPGDAAKAKRAADCNPFLAAPMQFGEKVVSSVLLPPKLLDEAVMQNRAVIENHVSVLDTFAPAFEAVKDRLCDPEEGGKQVLLKKRPTVQFKFGTGKKSFITAMSLQNEGNEKTAS
ncbi:transcription initiation factor TFIID subunit 8-like [Cornus florida]|uniref:transcription initiation factor TFIID subunit 8-like n=1 Tax=Cornus florida TaxID=4283 RepID=UPI00289A22D8|nr:transcription initiation factor TFIID subunit 8-like [Cornus florida]